TSRLSPSGRPPSRPWSDSGMSPAIRDQRWSSRPRGSPMRSAGRCGTCGSPGGRSPIRRGKSRRSSPNRSATGRRVSSRPSAEPMVFARRSSPPSTCPPSRTSSRERSPNSPASSRAPQVTVSARNSRRPRAACVRSRPRAPRTWPAGSGHPAGEGPDPKANRFDPRAARTDRGGRTVKRVSTHIEGLDEILGGGIPEGNVVLVSGAPGTMKTSLTYHILHSSALDGSRGLYVSLEQGRASLIDHTEGLGYRLDDTHGNLSVLDLGTLRKKLAGASEQPWLDLFKLYTQGIRKSFDYRFLVLDSLDALEILAKFREPRREMFSLIRWLRDLHCTS